MGGPEATFSQIHKKYLMRNEYLFVSIKEITLGSSLLLSSGFVVCFILFLLCRIPTLGMEIV